MIHSPNVLLLAAARVAAVLCCTGLHAVGAQTPVLQQPTLEMPDPQQQVDALVAAARALPFVAGGELAYGRGLGPPFPFEVQQTHRAAMQAARALGWRPQKLAELLDHDDSEVRLMAAWGLYRLADARWLPELGALAGDGGVVPHRLRLLGALDDEEIERWHREHPEHLFTTVGREVSSWLASWAAPPAGGAAFDAWCARQQELAPTAVCLRVNAQLAFQGTVSSSHWDAQALLDVLRAAQSARRGAAEIAQIALLSDKYLGLRGVFPDIESHLEFAARRLGRPNVLRLLRGEPPVIDGAPLDRANYAGFEDGFARFVLERPGRVGLLPADADALLALGRGTGRLASFRAAARLRPADALPILREALDRPVDHTVGLDFADCALLLWDLQPAASAGYLAEWFHTDVDGLPRVFPTHRARLAVHLLTNYEPADRQMFARLVGDPRFDATPPSALVAIVRTLNLANMEPVVPEQELSELRHPLGADRAFEDLAVARARHPDATATLRATLAAWRQAIRDHVADW